MKLSSIAYRAMLRGRTSRWAWLLSMMTYISSVSPLGAQSVFHVETHPKKGQGVKALLRSYGAMTPCNEAYFYKANGMKKGSGLSALVSYKLPILIYPYNGKSIRSTLGIKDWKRAKQIQDLNDAAFDAGLKVKDYKNDRVLWVPYHFLNCPDEVAVPIGGEIEMSMLSAAEGSGLGLRGTYSIFGEKHARVPLINNSLKGKVFYVVSGHGGPDPGAVGQYGRKNLAEDEYAYDIALRLTRNLLAYGATAYLIIRDPDDGIRSGEILAMDRDETCWKDQSIPASQADRLMQRSDAINALYKKNKKQGVSFQRSVVIHIDSNSKKKSTDVYFYHQFENEASKNFAEILLKTMKAKYDKYRKGRGYEGTINTRDLHMLREVEVTSVFMELGNIRNSNDQVRFIKERNRQLVADWLSEGIILEAKGKKK